MNDAVMDVLDKLEPMVQAAIFFAKRAASESRADEIDFIRMPEILELKRVASSCLRMTITDEERAELSLMIAKLEAIEDFVKN